MNTGWLGRGDTHFDRDGIIVWIHKNSDADVHLLSSIPDTVNIRPAPQRANYSTSMNIRIKSPESSLVPDAQSKVFYIYKQASTSLLKVSRSEGLDLSI